MPVGHDAPPGACSSHLGPQAYGLVGVRPHGPDPYEHAPVRRVTLGGGAVITGGVSRSAPAPAAGSLVRPGQVQPGTVHQPSASAHVGSNTGHPERAAPPVWPALW